MEAERFSLHPLRSDFSKFYASARFLAAGKNVYASVPGDLFGTERAHASAESGSLHPNLNTPFFILLTSPLARLEYRDAFRLFSLLSVLCAVLGVALLERGIGGREGVARLLLLLLLFFTYFPSLICVIGGQVSFFLFLLLVLCWRGVRTGREAGAGLVLGALVSLKLFTGMLVVCFIALRRWQLLAWCSLAAVACNAAAVYRMGWKTYAGYGGVLGSTTWFSASWNASLTGFFTRILGGSENVPLVNLPALGLGLGFALSLLAAGTVILLVARRRPTGGAGEDTAFCLAVVVMLLASPYGWLYYFPVLFLPLIVCWQAAAPPLGRVYRVALAAAWILSTVPHEHIPSPLNNAPLEWFTWQGTHFYALLLLAGTLAYLMGERGVHGPRQAGTRSA